MSEQAKLLRGVLYFVICAAPPAQKAHEFVRLAQASQWDVCVIATPNAVQFLDIPLLKQLTGYPVRSHYKTFGTPDIFPKMDAIVVAPMTLNTTSKWAYAMPDTLAIGQLCKGMRLRLPIVAAPCITTAYAQHPMFAESLALLRDYGVHILYDPKNYPAPHIVPWEVILSALQEVTGVWQEVTKM